MKKIAYLITSIIFLNLISVFATQASAIVPGIGNDPVSPATIDQFDSVFFDLYNVTVIGSSVEFPVSMRSNDVINALDFAFKYDHTQLEYDTIISLAAYIDYLSFYNTNDSTVRLTSYSFTQPYSNDTPLFKVRFNVLAGYACIDDFNSTTALLNGDLASHKFEQCQFTGIQEEEINAIKMYPNPAGDLLVIESPVEAEIQIMDLQGQQVGIAEKALAGKSTHINTSKLVNGIYFLNFSHEGRVATRKIIVNH